MYRGVTILLSLGLVAIWIISLATGGRSAWLTWIDGGAALVGFAAAGAFAGSARAGATVAGILSLGLFALWIISLAVGWAGWLVWCTFGFACAFLVVAVAALGDSASTARLRHA